VKKFQAILFDFDETLVCSRPAYYAAYWHIIEPYQLELPSAKQLFQQVWERSISPQEAFARLDSARAQELQLAFDQHYYQNHLQVVSAYPAVIELLTKLRAAGLKLAIISLKKRHMGEKELKACELDVFFDLIIWGDDVEKPKPAIEACECALEAFALNKTEILLCGDSPDDIKMGRAAEITTAAALWGDTNHQLLIEAQADYLLYHPQQLLELL
jgi:pyrophosphatase PpaX